jgi:hypothetical protein
MRQPTKIIQRSMSYRKSRVKLDDVTENMIVIG